MDLALNNLQRLICHKTQQTNKPNQITNPLYVAPDSWRRDRINTFMCALLQVIVDALSLSLSHTHTHIYIYIYIYIYIQY